MRNYLTENRKSLWEDADLEKSEVNQDFFVLKFKGIPKEFKYPYKNGWDFICQAVMIDMAVIKWSKTKPERSRYEIETKHSGNDIIIHLILDILTFDFDVVLNEEKDGPMNPFWECDKLGFWLNCNLIDATINFLLCCKIPDFKDNFEKIDPVFVPCFIL